MTVGMECAQAWHLPESMFECSHACVQVECCWLVLRSRSTWSLNSLLQHILFPQQVLRACHVVPDCVLLLNLPHAGRVLLAGAEERGDRGAAPVPGRSAGAIPHGTLAVQQADADDAQYRQAGAQGTAASTLCLGSGQDCSSCSGQWQDKAAVAPRNTFTLFLAAVMGCISRVQIVQQATSCLVAHLLSTKSPLPSLLPCRITPSLSSFQLPQDSSISFNLCNEPWPTYTISAVADRGMHPAAWTSAQLLDKALFLETMR